MGYDSVELLVECSRRKKYAISGLNQGIITEFESLPYLQAQTLVIGIVFCGR